MPATQSTPQPDEAHWGVLQQAADEAWAKAHATASNGDNPRLMFKNILGHRYDTEPDIQRHWLALQRSLFLETFASRCADTARKKAQRAMVVAVSTNGVAVSKKGTRYVVPNHARLRVRHDATKDVQRRIAEVYLWSLPSGKTLGQATISDLQQSSRIFSSNETANTVNRVYIDLIESTLRKTAHGNADAKVCDHISARQLGLLRSRAEKLVAKRRVIISRAA